MAEKTGFLGGSATLDFAAALLLLGVAAGLLVWYDQADELPAEVVTAAVPATPAPAVVPEPKPEPAPQPVVAAPEPAPAAQEPTLDAEVQLAAPVQPDAPATGTAPSFDEVRRESDGLTVIAGRAAPGSTVRVMLDGEEVAVVVADQRGSFAAIAQADADGQGHVLSLTSENAAGEATPSEDEILLTPLAPAVVAEVETPAETPEETPAETPAPVVAESPTEAAPVVAEATPEPESDTPAETALAAAPEAVTEPATADAPAPAPQPVAVLKANAEGVELVQGTESPQAMTNVALDTISYSDAGEVQLSGRAQDGAAEVRVYIDNAPLASLPVDAQGRWRGEVPNVDEGIYTLRVDELDGEGVVTSRVETPFKRESEAVLAEATAGTNGPIRAITVQKGATLWAIARDRYGDGLLYVRVFEANAKSIRDPDLIYPGQVFDLPD